ESGRAEDHRLLRGVGGGARQHRLRQRLQGAVGAVPAARRRGRPVEIHAGRGRQGRAARPVRAGELAQPPLGRRAPSGDLTMASVTLPTASGGTAVLTLAPPRRHPVDPTRFSRRAYAAAHVVADPLADVDPWLAPAIDWDRTLAFREHLWDLGLGVAE